MARRSKRQILWSSLAATAIALIWVFPPAYVIEFVGQLAALN